MHFDTPLNPKFVSYYFQTCQLSRREEQVRSSRKGQPNLRREPGEAARSLCRRWTSKSGSSAILDKFDALVNDLSIGLPAEINARRKQYEYYRDRLLTFEEAA